MPIYVNKQSLNVTYPRPNHEIDVRDKNAEWACSMAKYIYGQYVSGQCGITIEDAKRIAIWRTYLNGNQDYEKYKKRYLNQSKESKQNEYGHIAWEHVYSPMPKVVDKVLGMFISQDHACQASCVNEIAKQHRIKKYAEQYTAVKLQDTRRLLAMLAGLNPEEDPKNNPAYGYLAQDLQEIELMQVSGNFKLPYEIASEKAIDFTKKLSNYKHLKRKAVRDLMCGFMAWNEDLDPVNDTIKWGYTDIADVIIEYSSNQHFLNSSYGGVQELWKIEDLRTRGFHEEDLKKFAGMYFDYNMEIRGLTSQNKAFNTYCTRYGVTNSYGYDDFIVPIIRFAFKSNNVEYSKRVKIKNGETRLYPSDFGKITPDTVVSTTQKTYEVRWIVGTDSVLDFNEIYYCAKDNSGNTKLPIHVFKLEGKSIVERVIQVLDEFAMLGYKLQNALARSQGKQPMFDFSALEGITSNSGGKLHPFDVIEMYWQGAGMPFRSQPIDEVSNYQRSAPVIELEGGIGSYLNELLLLKQSYSADLAELTGITSFANADPNMPVTTQKLAVANMTDVLKPLYDGFLETKEAISYSTVYRIQLLLYHSPKALKEYGDRIGVHYAQYLKEAGEVEPMDIGITFEAMPTDEMKQHILMWADRATQGGKNGTPILKGSEYLWLVDNLNSQSGLKEARLILAHREEKDEQLAQQRQAGAIQQQAEANKQMVEVQGQIAANKVKVETQGALAIGQQKADLDLRNKKELQGDTETYNAVNRGIDAGYNQQNQQGNQQ